jgi:hypothetical protein
MTVPYRGGGRIPGPLGSSWGTGGRVPGPIGRTLWDKESPSSGSGTTVKATKHRAGSQVLYVPPTAPEPHTKNKIEYRWSFDTEEGRREYEAALLKHLKSNKILSGDTTFTPLSGIADIAKLANDTTAKLVLIVHGAGDSPAIAVRLGSGAAGIKPDWNKVEDFAKVIAPFGYPNITILGCDSVSNNFAPNLAKLLPKGSTVTGHEGGTYEIKRHFDFSPKIKGHLQLTHLTSNLQLKTFQTEGKNP